MTDEATGETVEFGSRKLAEEAADLLNRAEHGDVPPLPSDPSPFPAFDVFHGLDGWVYISHGDGAVQTDNVARSRSEGLASRTAELLARAHARPRRPWQGRRISSPF